MTLYNLNYLSTNGAEVTLQGLHKNELISEIENLFDKGVKNITISREQVEL